MYKAYAVNAARKYLFVSKFCKDSCNVICNPLEVIAEALQLLEKRNHYDRWVEKLHNKIDIAAAELDRGEWLDGEIAINQLRAKLHGT